MNAMSLPNGTVSIPMRHAMSSMLVAGIAVVAVVLGMAMSACGCSQLQAAIPVIDNVEALVMADLKAGKPLSVIETDVSALLCGAADAAPTICVDVVEVVDAALTMLIDTGVLPAWLLPVAHQYHGAEKAVLSSRGPAK